MNPVWLILLVGAVYVLLFGGLSLLRREGLSGRFALEAFVVTGLAGALVTLTGTPLSPILFLIVLYLITMRVRVLADLGNMLARRRDFRRAGQLYNLALNLWPDESGRLIVQVNQATALLEMGALDPSVVLFREILGKAGEGFLGVKYEAAAHFNLGVAYRRQHLDSQAITEFNAVLDTWPSSEFARQAERALQQVRASPHSPSNP